ncbi:MAG: hypothetical protein MUC35_04290 [Candidatus Margulisbacteria bacterium]|jgi:hypothetical protein|nr:hypothetical protein [Candidatus Margulisiibacteriota bacterium]
MPFLLIIFFLCSLLPGAADARLYRYGALTVEARAVNWDKGAKVVELTGFRGTYESYALSGDYFRINTGTGNFSGQNLKVGYLTAYLQVAAVEYNGRKVDAANVTAAPFEQPLFSANLGELELYPGYLLARHNTLKLSVVPFYYIPLYFSDLRRSYFPLPFPALELGKDIYHGSAGAVHTNYFFSPQLFGDLALRASETDGAGLGIQQVVRLADYHQLNASAVGWQKSPAQFKLSYVFNYFPAPTRPNHPLSFQEQSKLIQDTAQAETLISVRADYSQNEDFSRGRIDRAPDLLANIKFKGVLFDHVYTLTPYISHGRLRETKIFPEIGAPQSVDRSYQRQGVGFDCTYFLDTPFVKPYVNRALLTLNLLHNNYEPGPASRDRLASSLTIRRPLLTLAGLSYELVLTKVLANNGQSPFFFEEYGWQLLDHAALDLYLQNDRLLAGTQVVYDLISGTPYNEIYYAGIKAVGDSYAAIRHDRRMQSWEFAFMRKEEVF